MIAALRAGLAAHLVGVVLLGALVGGPAMGDAAPGSASTATAQPTATATGAATEPELRTARAVPTKYYLSLPANWSARGTWPVLVCIDGSGHDFLRNAQQFAAARGNRPFIVVTPCVTSNGNDPADLAAVLAIADEVKTDFHGQPRFFITGFSAGGHVAWQLVFLHPDHIAGAVLAAGNFRFRGITAISQSPARVHLPIQGFQGDQDGARAALNQQWADAEQLARQNGYQNLTHTMVPGASHQAFPKETLDYLTTLLPHGTPGF